MAFVNRLAAFVFASATFHIVHFIIPIPGIGTLIALLAAGAVGGFLVFGFLSPGTIIGYGMQVTGIWFIIGGTLLVALAGLAWSQILAGMALGVVDAIWQLLPGGILVTGIIGIVLGAALIVGGAFVARRI